jgi:antitoxin ParD1/3/4
MNMSYQMNREADMAGVSKRTFSLPQEQAAFIDRKVAAGDYASGSEVIREGLRALQARDAAIERWLREEVAPTYDAVKADPSKLIPAEDVKRMIDGWVAQRVKDAG